MAAAHPTPFPGKHRIGLKSTAPTDDGAKVAKKPPWQNVPSAQMRPKRTFGVPRNTNVPAEKSLLISKPRKIRDAAKNTPNTDLVPTTKAAVPATGKKKHQVSFQDPKTTVSKTSERDEPEEAVRTPISFVKPAVVGTPYLSAQNCSKCKLDKLESSTYWLAQIRLAETAGKHSVSAAFFRLALECHAQPFHKLRSELRHYLRRHQINSAESLWTDLFQAYGLAKEKLVYFSCDFVQNNTLLAEMNNSVDEPDAELCNIEQSHVSIVEKDDFKTNSDTHLFGCVSPSDACPGHDAIGQVGAGNNFHGGAKVKENHCDKMEVEKMEQTECPSIDTLKTCCSVIENCSDEKEWGKTEQSERSERKSIDNLIGSNCSVVANSPCVAKPLEDKVLEIKSCGDSLKKRSELCSDISSQQIKIPTVCPYTRKGRETLVQNQESSKVSANNAVRIKDGKCKKERSRLILFQKQGK
ncbi:hypothetical protein Cni_G23615 [Canna indica]|uniref:Uncharacterized protein n=1 Tax=Canna indica TaxID=4628 RepID=A0AAQ3QKL4_9LILI|nr:hypothetical protein Cni_G23615 [Canna indica]